jgi:D-alanyl-D-alanine carboxypeptidase
MPRGPLRLLPLVLAVLVAACAGVPPPGGDRTPPTTERAAPATSAAAPTSPPTTAAWRLGARPLPLRPDGFGKALPTPPQLRRRALPTVDRLPPPRDGRFAARVAPVSPAIRARMGASWNPSCPVRLADLRYLTVSFRGFDGRAHTGELVVHQRVARQVVGVFQRLYQARFPIEEMRLVTTADLNAHPTGDGNNTAAFVCRAARRQTRWSAHAYGLAVDVDPFQNPYHRGDLVLPELASAYLDRDNQRPGMIRQGDVVTRAFAAVGWTWGGTFRTPKDLMHFSATGT